MIALTLTDRSDLQLKAEALIPFDFVELTRYYPLGPVSLSLLELGHLSGFFTDQADQRPILAAPKAPKFLLHHHYW